MWLQTFKHNLYLTLKKLEGNIRKMLMRIVEINQISRLKMKFSFDNKILKTIWSLEKLDYQRLGSFTIVKQINIVAFQLELVDSMKIHPMFRVSLLEPYHVSTILGRTHKPPPPIIVDDEQEYEVEEILNSRISYRQLQYLVH
jgi:hypothetical protein